MRRKVQEAYLQWSPTKRVRESRRKKKKGEAADCKGKGERGLT
jgi:hypothetical protein